MHYFKVALWRPSRFSLSQGMQRTDVSGVWWTCSLGSLSDHPEKAGTLQEEESLWLLGRLGKSELIKLHLQVRVEWRAGPLSLP